MVAEGQNPKIIVSYRRADSAMAGRIFDRLAQHFGKTNLFIDIDNVPFGVDFRKHIDDALQASNILIAIVGEKWLGPKADGKLRIMSDADPVRVELETALRRGITVLPVLIDGTSMPDPAELPDTIRDFAYRNAVEVESGRDFNVHVERLIRAVEQIVGGKAMPAAPTPSQISPLLSPAPPTTRRRPWPLILGLLGLLAVAALALWYGRDWIQTAGTNPSAATPYCEELKRVIAEAKTNFVSILGPGSTDSWPSRIQLPGWYDCRVIDFTFEGVTKRFFYCGLPPFATLGDVNARRDAVTAYVGPCLGPDWARRRSQFADKTTDTIYYMGADDPQVRIRESYVKDTQEWTLQLEVEAPASASKPLPKAETP
jgi:hypothetical protein